KRDTKIVVRFRVGRIYRQRSFVMRDRVVKFAFFNQSTSKIIMRFGVIRPQRDRLAIMSNRLVSFALVAENDTQIVMRHPAAGIFRQRCCVQCYQVAVDPALPPRQKTKQQQEYSADDGAEKDFHLRESATAVIPAPAKASGPMLAR